MRPRPSRLRIPRSVEIAGSVDAARLLASAMGVGQASRALAEVAAGALRGEPWGSLPPPAHRRERLSRRQAGQAILLERALSRRLGPEAGLELTREVVLDATLRFLGWAIGPLSRRKVEALSASAREALLRRTSSRFFNADVRWVELSEERARLVVTHCLFPGLCRAVGAERVAPLLCAGDAVYFERVLGAELQRPETIASGGACCPFEIRWRD